MDISPAFPSEDGPRASRWQTRRGAEERIERGQGPSISATSPPLHTPSQWYDRESTFKK